MFGGSFHSQNGKGMVKSISVVAQEKEENKKLLMVKADLLECFRFTSSFCINVSNFRNASLSDFLVKSWGS